MRIEKISFPAWDKGYREEMNKYKPPIDVTFRDTIESIEKEWVNGVDNYIVSTVREVTGVDVDKQRLINALMIDKKLVRCKDCKFWGTEQDGYCAAIDDPYMLETEEDDFCSWGEKRDE